MAARDHLLTDMVNTFDVMMNLEFGHFNPKAAFLVCAHKRQCYQISDANISDRNTSDRETEVDMD